MKSTQLIQESKAYKPFNYPWAYEFWQKQQQIHWLPEEIPLSEDVKDWNSKLTECEREFLTQIFRFFTQADIDVSGGYIDRYMPFFKPVEVRMMMSAFANMETVHIAAYALLIETIGMPDVEFSRFLEYQEMADKHDFLNNFNMKTEQDVLKTIAVFSGFTEGLQLFASFAMLLNFPRFGKMRGMGQVITWSVRDESLHCEGMIKLFHEYANETGAYDHSVKKSIIDVAKQSVALEDRFIDLVFQAGAIHGIDADSLKRYIRYICDWRLNQLGIESFYNIKEYPLLWLKSLLNGVEHANFFETRATEYSKGATSGTWQETWLHFDQAYPQTAKVLEEAA